MSLLSTAVLLQACSGNSQNSFQHALQQLGLEDVFKEGPVKVEVRQQEQGNYQLYRGGEPYYIKGGGYVGESANSQYMQQLAAHGGNSIRTWTTVGAQEMLDRAHKLGLTVTLGLDVVRERHGFDYNDSLAVAQQLERLRADVLQFKDHPALLMWGIGNELDLHYTNIKVWDAVNDIAKMIHQEDPNHPATTMLAGIKYPEIYLLDSMAPALDLLSFNVYAPLPAVPQKLREWGWKGPYIISEWGPTGYWEVATTAWGAPIEESSSEKAAAYKSRYEASMAQDTEQNLGSYVFLWGQKQERTPTWFGLFTEEGHKTAAVDIMRYLWTGAWPKNWVPQLDSLRLNGKRAEENIYLKPGESYPAHAAALDPDGDALSYRWELLPESTDLKDGGDWERRPQALPNLFLSAKAGSLELKAPETEGAYRLFVYVTDGHAGVATANIPFYVKQ